MPDFNTLHLFNIGGRTESELTDYFEKTVLPAVRRLRGFTRAQLYSCSPHQLMPAARQPWAYGVLYEFTLDDPEIDLPALAPVLADMRDAGLIANDDAERNYSYRMYHPWKFSGNYKPGPFTDLMFLLANFVPGHEAEYHKWYDDVHSVEVSNSPGYVGMRRGGLCEVQVPPRRFCPGDQLILGGIQTDDLPGTLQEFFDRAEGKSDPSVNWGPRNSSASLGRTVHVFSSVAGPFEAA